MMKSLKNGKLAVLVSYGYGAGWYTWHHVEELLFDPKIVDMVLDNAGEQAIVEYCEQTYGTNHYYGGADGLTVEFVTPGTKFRIEEYDGAETLMREEDYNDWFTA